MDIQRTSTVNPFFEMWFKPRSTIQHFIDNPNDTIYIVNIFAILMGINNMYDHAITYNWGYRGGLINIFFSIIINGSIVGLITFYLFSFCLYWTGKLFRGKALFHHMKIALAFSFIPAIFSMILWIPELYFYREDVFKTTQVIKDSSNIFLYLKSSLEFILSLWALVLLVISISKVQHFSLIKSAMNILLSCILLVSPLLLVIFIVRII